QGQNGTEIPGLNIAVGENILTGDLTLSQSFLPAGTLKFNFPDVSLLAALAAQNASGSASGDIKISNENSVLSADVTANAPLVASSGARIEGLKADIDIADLSNLVINGNIAAKRISSGAN